MQMESLSSEECDSGELFCREEHIFWIGAATAAIGYIEVPVGGAEIGFFCESQRSSCAVDCLHIGFGTGADLQGL